MDGSFWSGGFDFGNAASGIEEILGKDSFTLEELLGHDDVISECKWD